jgi:hypothetical protein
LWCLHRLRCPGTAKIQLEVLGQLEVLAGVGLEPQPVEEETAMTQLEAVLQAHINELQSLCRNAAKWTHAEMVRVVGHSTPHTDTLSRLVQEVRVAAGLVV